MATFTSKPIENGSAEATKAAEQIYRGVSPFQDGKTFTITGWHFNTDTVNGTELNNYRLVLDTSLGDLSVNTLFRAKVGKDSKVYYPEGTYIQAVKNALKPGMTNKQVGDTLVKLAKGKKICIVRRAIIVDSEYSKSGAVSALIDLYFEDNSAK